MRRSWESILRAGADVIRINLSHGALEEHLRRAAMVREVAATMDRPVGVLADLPGPKIRAGRFPEDGAELAPGEIVSLVPGDGPSDAERICVEYDTSCSTWISATASSSATAPSR